jgi:DNA polymerase III, beta subunit
MKFTIPANLLNEHALFASKAISARPITPVMGGILIDASAETVTLTGQDYTETASTKVQAQVEEPGRALVQARMLTDLLKKFRNRTVELHAVEGAVTLQAGSAVFNLPSMKFNDYPALADLPDIAGTVDGGELAHAISMVSGAASTDDALPILTSINVTAEGDELRFHATDRYRLAEIVIGWKSLGANFTVNLKGSWLSSIGKTAAGETHLLRTNSMFGIASGQRVSTTGIVDGDFPNLSTLFPADLEDLADIDRSALSEALDRVGGFVERGKAVRLHFTPGKVTLDGGTLDSGQGSETLAINYDGPELTAGFNVGYLAWSVNTLMTERIHIGPDQRRPALIVPTAGATRHLVMPINLKEDQ